jgi:multiple sugar transport system permease protein
VTVRATFELATTPRPEEPVSGSRRRTSGRRGRRLTLGSASRVVFLLALALYFGLPIIWIALAPSKTREQLSAENPFSFGSFDNYRVAFQHLLEFNDGLIYRWMVNSAVYASASVLLALITCIPAGYALAHTTMKAKRLVLITTLIVMITPGAARTIPLFLEVSSAGLANTPWAVILPEGFFPFGVYLSYIYFSSSVSPSILEAARVDGASEFGTFRMAVGMARPLVGLLTFFSFIHGWNDYFLPFVMLNTDRLYNLPVGIGALIAGSPGVQPANSTSDLPIYQPEVALAGLLAVVPILIIYLACQRYLTTGLLDGAVKN